MALIEVKEPRKNVSVRTAQLVQLLSELGPDIPEISRRLGQFKESVRYRYKEKILNNGFAVQAAPNHERLGLRRIIALVDFTDEFREYSSSILAAMPSLCYVTGFEKTLPHGKYIVSASVPTEHYESFSEFMKGLRSKGIFASVELFEFDTFRNAPMKAEFFNFDTGTWDFDWSETSLRDFGEAGYTLAEKAKIDSVDLQIIEQLQMDANKSLKEISEQLKVNYKKLAWHYSTHVLARNLIRGYRINWMGTKYNEKSGKASQRQHRYFIAELVVRDTNELERMTLCKKIGQLPFLWAEATGRDYAAEFAFPVDYVTEGYQYLENAIAPVKHKAEILAIDQTASLGFSITPQLFDQDKRSWAFNRQEISALFDNLVIKIREVRAG